MKCVQTTLSLLLATAAVGCSGEDTIDIGERDVASLGSALSDYAASWDGYAEAYQFEDGSDRVRLTLDEDGQGLLQVGDSPPLPPPTNPDVGYPESKDWAVADYGVSELQAGFDYSVYDPALESRRIRFRVKPADLIAPWCQMQTPVLFFEATADSEAQYDCAPNGVVNLGDAGECSVLGPTNDPVPIDCGKLRLCYDMGACSCTELSCDANDHGEISFDGALADEGRELVGTLLLSEDERITVRLSRDPQ